ncbi:hypothetical protein ACRAWD_03180 [Caulobacter segnis]
MPPRWSYDEGPAGRGRGAAGPPSRLLLGDRSVVRPAALFAAPPGRSADRRPRRRSRCTDGREKSLVRAASSRFDMAEPGGRRPVYLGGWAWPASWPAPRNPPPDRARPPGPSRRASRPAPRRHDPEGSPGRDPASAWMKAPRLLVVEAALAGELAPFGADPCRSTPCPKRPAGQRSRVRRVYDLLGEAHGTYRLGAAIRTREGQEEGAGLSTGAAGLLLGELEI